MTTQKPERDRNLAWVASTPQGRAFLYDLIYGTCHADRLSMTQDAGFTAFNEGARSIGLAINDRLKTEQPSMWVRMLTENLSEDDHG